MKILESLKHIGIVGFLDIILMAILIYAVLVWLKGKKAAFVLWGILIFGIIYLLAHQFNLLLISYVLRGFFAVILLALIVIFRDELRDFFEEIAVWSIDRQRRGRKIRHLPPKKIETLVRTVFDMAREKIGALIVIRGKQMIARYLEGGVPLDGLPSEPILKSIFDPHSFGHDGAVIIENERISEIGAHLPLSHNLKKLSNVGTRHAAALGLSEVSDSICIVVSEEKGTVSITRHGDLIKVENPEKLTKILEKFYADHFPEIKGSAWKYFFKKNTLEKVLAFAMALALWFVLILGARLVQKDFEIPVEYPALSSNLYVKEVSPEKVKVTFSGPRSAFHLMNEKNIRLSLKLTNAREGLNTVPIKESNLTFPKDITLEDIEPTLIKVRIEKYTEP